MALPEKRRKNGAAGTSRKRFVKFFLLEDFSSTRRKQISDLQNLSSISQNRNYKCTVSYIFERYQKHPIWPSFWFNVYTVQVATS